MASNHTQGGNAGAGGGSEGARQRPPEWADGLKQLYDSVVEEALPNSFKDLLDRLDAIDPVRHTTGDGDASRDDRGARR